MSDTDKSLSEMDHLEDLFAAARSDPTPVPQALQAAILADAQQIQNNRAMASDTSRATGQSRQLPQRLWQQFISAVGGWPALGGLAAASLTGLWIGLAPPSFLPDPVESFASYSSGSQLITDLDYDVSFLVSDEVFE
ncbi:hypothetical protein [Pseudophaeobacter sp. EL27]|uniref:hypothetical protein n=1 Tax=Pseudophaeobacter sp. EL27 TaxID=2107580 RepID=UPI000EFC107B|nr:hypothetical protein [Pseudophaeobacter sp. EL27]